MEKTKRIVDSLIEIDPNWKEVQGYISNIEKYDNKDPGSAIGQCKGLMEAIFKTITKTNKHNYLINTFEEASKVLKLEESYENVITPFCIFINKTRNKLDKNAHPKDIATLSKNKKAMSDAETYFWIALTDNVASYILDCYKKLTTYNKNKKLNDWFDESGGKPNLDESGDKSNSWMLFKNEPDKYSLFAELQNSSNFSYTSQIVEKFRAGEYQFSDIEIKVLRKIYVSNHQIYYLVQNYLHKYDNLLIKEFFELISKKQDLFTKDEFNEFFERFKT